MESELTMTDPQHLQQLIQVEDERVKEDLKYEDERVEKMVEALKFEVESLSRDHSYKSTKMQFIENAFKSLREHQLRRDTLRELLTK